MKETNSDFQMGSRQAVNQMKKTHSNFDEQMNVVEETSMIFTKISTLVGTIALSISTINSEIKEVALTKDEVIYVMAGIASASEEVSASAEEQLKAIRTVTESSEQLMELSIDLKEVVERFKLEQA
ncbi:hypothetical protein AWH49_03470 [Domibacillus aminovorans]|uniref:Methyl-accepting transducer domain-containing protein n=2 Tax=Domibacillus aminovorans TaxID=29332 RepID=A0A177KZA0_9BACI|nr:hypothetical protein AWH49_03470 [Domibacillus aminovorans]